MLRVNEPTLSYRRYILARVMRRVGRAPTVKHKMRRVVRSYRRIRLSARNSYEKASAGAAVNKKAVVAGDGRRVSWQRQMAEGAQHARRYNLPLLACSRTLC